MWLCLQASIESLTVSSVGTTVSNGLWGLDRIDQQSRKRDYMYHYSSVGTGVHVYTVDTVSHQRTMSICNYLCCCTQQLLALTCESHSCRQSLSAVDTVSHHLSVCAAKPACLPTIPFPAVNTMVHEPYMFELSPAHTEALLLTYQSIYHHLHLSCACMQALAAVTAA